MIASDFILQTRDDLQEKSEHWSDESLLIKLQRAYVALQSELPYFIYSQSIEIPSGTIECYLDHKPIKNITLKIDNIFYTFTNIDKFFTSSAMYQYTFLENKLLLTSALNKDVVATVSFKIAKYIESMSCEIEIAMEYLEALRLLLMAYIHEKPTRNSKERNLSTHYLNLYALEVKRLKRNSNIRPKNIGSNYIKV